MRFYEIMRLARRWVTLDRAIADDDRALLLEILNSVEAIVLAQGVHAIRGEHGTTERQSG